MLKLFIETGNAAFEEDPGHEFARILRKLADQLEAGDLNGYRKLFDYNGNAVGECQISEGE